MGLGLGDILGGVGGLIGAAAGGNSQKQKQRTQMMAALHTLQDADVQSPDSLMAKVQSDPQAMIALRAALTRMSDEASNPSGGAITAARNAEAASAMNQRQAAEEKNAEQNAAQRGMSNGGAGLLQKQVGQQASSNANAQYGAQTAAEAQQRALQATAAQSQMGQGLENTTFGEQASKAQAQDLVNRFNAGQRWNQAQGISGQQNAIAGWHGGESARLTGVGAGIGKGIGELAGAGITGGASAFMPEDSGGGGGAAYENYTGYGAGGYSKGGIVIPKAKPMPIDLGSFLSKLPRGK